MLISEKMNKALNQQVGNEFGASMQYVSIASHFAGEALNELAALFYAQADEERDHAMRIVKYVSDAGGQVEIPAIPAPRSQFAHTEEAVRHSLESERTVTAQINQLVELAIKESDHLTQNELTWFVREQLEEVSSMDTLHKVVQRAGEQNLVYVESYVARLRDKSPEGNG